MSRFWVFKRRGSCNWYDSKSTEKILLHISEVLEVNIKDDKIFTLCEKLTINMWDLNYKIKFDDTGQILSKNSSIHPVLSFINTILNYQQFTHFDDFLESFTLNSWTIKENFIVIWYNNGYIRCIDLIKQHTFSYKLSTEKINSLSISPDNQYILFGLSNTVSIFNIENKEILISLRVNYHFGSVIMKLT